MLENELRAAVARGVPITFVRTQDQPNAINSINKMFGAKWPIFVQDTTRGFTAINESAMNLIQAILDGLDPAVMTEPQVMLDCLRKNLPKNRKVMVISMAADRWLDKPIPALAALLLRDEFKEKLSMLVCLGTAFLPASELGADIVVVDDPPPSEEERKAIIETTAKNVGADSKEFKLTDETRAGLLTFTRGLSAFSCEQTCALAAQRTGFDLAKAEKVWREQIDGTPGLRVLTDRPTPDMVAGLDGWMLRVQRLKNARQPIEAVVFVDEIEKALAGSSGAVADSSGSSQQVLGRMLSEMEDTKAEGAVFYGPPGTGKSHAAQAAGMALGVPTIAFVPSDVKDSLVGGTEKNMVRAMSVLRALAGRAYWIATCNGLASLPPELLRRYTDGIFFFDLPGDVEREKIWAVHLKSRGFALTERWDRDELWTGADIRNVVRSAWNANVPVAEIAKDHVPSSRANLDMITRLRQLAHGAYRSAQYPGAYTQPLPSGGMSSAPKGRKFSMEE